MQLWGQQHPFIIKRFKTFTCLHSVCLRMKCRRNSSVNLRDTESSWPPCWHLHDLVCDLNCFSDILSDSNIKEMTWNKARKRYIQQSNPQTLYWPEFIHCFLMWRLPPSFSAVFFPNACHSDEWKSVLLSLTLQEFIVPPAPWIMHP